MILSMSGVKTYAKLSRVLLLGCFVTSLAPLGRTQVLKDAPAPLSKLEEQIRQHPNNPKLYVELGLAYWDHNDYAHALEAFQRAVKCGPSSADAHNWLGVAILEKGDFAGAVSEFRKAISLNPKYSRAYTNLGSALAKDGDLAGAIHSFHQALALEPENPATHMNLAVALRDSGDAKGALTHLRFVARREPNNANVQYMLGQTLQQSGDLGAAVEAFENALRADPEFREGYYALGLALKQQAASARKPNPHAPSPADGLYKRGQEAASRGELKEAEQLLREAITQDDAHAGAQNLLGYILGQEGNLTDALSHLRRAISLEPDLADAHYNVGVALWYSGSKTQSVSELQKAVQLDVAAGASYAFLGTALRDTGQLEHARVALQRAIAILPSYPAAYVDLAVVFLRSGDLDKGIGQIEAALHVPTPSGPIPDWDTAIASIRQILSATPDRAEVHNVLGLLLGRKGANSDEVLAEFRDAVRLRPDFAEAHNNIGLVLAQANDENAAIKEFREAVRLQPNYADAHANLGAALVSTHGTGAVQELEKAVALAPGLLKAQFNLAVAYSEDPNYGPAKEIEQLRKVIAADPTLAAAHLALGKALRAEGEVDESIRAFREAVRLDSQNTAAHYQLGLALARAGYKDEAAAELQRSRELASSDDRKQNADLDIAEGRVALDNNDLAQAAVKFRHALMLQPESSDAQHLLALVLEKKGDAEGASVAYRKTLELNPGDFSAREKIEMLSSGKKAGDDQSSIARFELFIRDRRFQEVEPLLSAYVKEHPNSSWGWYAFGYTLFAERKIGQSIQALATSLQLDVKNAEAHKILGRDLMVIGRLDAAQTEFEQGVRYDPQSAEMHFNLGKLFSIRDDWSSARTEFEAAVRIDPTYMEGLDGLGFAQEALGDDAGAVVSYEKAIAINDANKGKFVSSHVNLSAYYNRKGDHEKALEFANAALNLDPKSDGAWFQKAKANEAQGDLNGAADALSKAISCNPRASAYYYVLAQVYRRVGKAPESRKALDSFIRLDKETNDIEEVRRSLARHSDEHARPN